MGAYSITDSQKAKLLKDIWIAHDGRWFLKTVVKNGFDTATALNLEVVKSLGKTEIKRLVAELGNIEVKNIEDFEKFMRIAAEVYFPVEHKYEFSVLDNSNLIGKVIQCYVHHNVCLAGTTHIHQCAGKKRFNSWLKALDLEGEVSNTANTDNCNGTCEFVFTIQW
jgi:uncharacterized protein DUF6125